MAEYIDPPLAAEPGLKYEEMVAELQARWPGWTPADANLEVQVLLAVANLSASDEQTASGALTSIFRWFGQNLVPGGQSEEAVAASGTITVVLNENPSGVTIPAGTTYGVDVGEEALLGFEVVIDQDIAPGVLTATGIPVIAGNEGAVGNDLTGDLVQVDPLGFVASVTFDTPTAGGVDAEEDDVYLDRLRALLQIQAPRPIIAEDFAIMARSVPGVERATAIDGYDPADHAAFDPNDPVTWKERFVTVSVIDADGEDPGATVRTAVDTMFNGSAALGIPARREVNFVTVVQPPTYTPIDVFFTAVAWPTWNPADVQAAAVAAVTEYLQPYLWGQTGFGEARGWENQATLTADSLYATLRTVEGLRNVTDLKFGAGGFYDDFSTNTLADYTFTVGAGTLAVSGGKLVPDAAPAQKRFYRPSGGIDGLGNYYDTEVAMKYTTGSTLTNQSTDLIVHRLDSNNRLYGYIFDASTMEIAKTDGGVQSILPATVTGSHTLVANTTYWMDMRVVGNVVTLEHWTTDPALGGTPAATATYTLTGADATKFGAGVKGQIGVDVDPKGTASQYSYDDLRATGAVGSSPFALYGAPGPVLTRPNRIVGAVT